MEQLFEDDFDVTITVTGNSMSPLWVHKRDTVTLTKCDMADLKRGDIPFYLKDNGQFVMHRIIGVKANSYHLCGDAQTDIEYFSKKENIFAVVKAFNRKGKEYSCRDLWYRIYMVLWVGLRPFRPILMKGYRYARRRVPHNGQQ